MSMIHSQKESLGTYGKERILIDDMDPLAKAKILSNCQEMLWLIWPVRRSQGMPQVDTLKASISGRLRWSTAALICRLQTCQVLSLLQCLWLYLHVWHFLVWHYLVETLRNTFCNWNVSSGVAAAGSVSIFACVALLLAALAHYLVAANKICTLLWTNRFCNLEKYRVCQL